ncbi:hypothetical protein C3489_24265 [Streptomyces sp. Ru71]|uniref:hypothetical protein n=1 Tax=Streptomyces sp. Ru71 TaxID=2080746 RepID=UPI000CDD1C23|nr:hypothetical protein [Streptomyces sp. Ru71]POX49641.1 hypothetical protein C3489_24265 [Streptomyces sp. Ru71]
MASDTTCDMLREYDAELALGILSGRQRAEAVGHLERCAGCREHVRQLTLVGDRLVGLLPDCEPPLGFETRLARRLPQEATAYEGRPSARGDPHRLRGRVRRTRLRLLAVAAAFAVAFGFAGWAVGTTVDQGTATAPIATESEAVLVGDMTSADVARGDQPVGEVYAHPGSPGWIFVSVDLGGRAGAYDGRVDCLLERSDGTAVRVGAFTLRDGRGYWGVAAHVDPTVLSGARLTSPDGTVLATAHLQTRHVVVPAD